ncbi:transcription termination factor MTERF2, chloroplastic isoform X2 [Abrus precatorius]|uniref:Transcription termination factor MTERF2, chloroplastic isoform X2 n=1 Tax=Abrus precatorius TaxID=3816 RepID=A0A8B8LIN0_ABRPR|nr:transcription termination factor MTERF2, chloroplastic isoform X2 [Abrus precatorius]
MLFSCQKYNLHLPCSSVILQNPTTSTVVKCQNPNVPNEQQHAILRKHNSKSTSFLLHHISHKDGVENPKPSELQDPMPHEEKVKVLELSLVRKRTPQFPGSIYAQSPSDTDVGSSLPPLRTLFQSSANNHDKEDEEMLMRALEIRRKVTEEVFKEALRKGKFGITYTTNVVNRIPAFIDHIMIEAANLKRLPQYSSSTFNLRAKTVIDDSQVVPLIRWLKHHAISYPRIAKLIVMSRGKLESIRSFVEWLKSVHVKGEFLGVVMLNAGDNILQCSHEELDEIVRYLESNGVRRDWMGYVISRCPQLLSYTLEEVKIRVQFYLDMGLNEKDFGTMVFDFPKVLGYYSLEEMNLKVNYLKEFGLQRKDVGKLLAFRPQLMACSIDEQWKPLVKYLYYYGITRDGMRRMLTIKPMVFCIDLQMTIVPKVKFLQDIGVRNDAIGNMLVKFPTLLTYSLHKKIRPVVIFLMTKAGVSEKDIGKVIALGPELLGCHIVHKLEVNVKYFLSLGIRLKQLGEMIADFPMLLRYNIDVLRPKYSYLRKTMVRPLEDIIEFPSYSLDGRIIPRHKVLVENQINVKLRYMLASSNEEFNKMVKSIIKKRQRFESAVMNEDTTQHHSVVTRDITTRDANNSN